MTGLGRLPRPGELDTLWLAHECFDTAIRVGDRHGDFAPGEREELLVTRAAIARRIVDLSVAVLDG